MVTYRSVLEVLKWSSPEDTLRDASCVSTHWQTASESGELWMEYCEGIDCEDFRSSHKQRFRHFRQSHILALLAPKKLFLYDIDGDKWRTVQLSNEITVDKSTAWVAVGRDFICAGGGAGFSPEDDIDEQELQCAFKVFRCGEVRKLGDMALPRMWHGMVRYKDSCFVFGGLADAFGFEDSNSVEKISVSRLTQWEPEAPMISRRRCFNPCLWQSRIYIFGGNCTQSEVFFPEESRYEALPLQCRQDHCSAARNSKGFVIMGENYASTWDGESQSSRDFPVDFTWGNMSPVLSKNRYWISQAYNNFVVVRLDLQSEKVAAFNPPDFQKSDFHMEE